MKMGKTATYTVPSRVAQDLRALSLMLGVIIFQLRQHLGMYLLLLKWPFLLLPYPINWSRIHSQLRLHDRPTFRMLAF